MAVLSLYPRLVGRVGLAKIVLTLLQKRALLRIESHLFGLPQVLEGSARLQHVADAFCKDDGVRRFRDEIRRAHLESLFDEVDVTHSRGHQNGDIPTCLEIPNGLANLEPLHVGHLDVEQDHVGFALQGVSPRAEG